MLWNYRYLILHWQKRLELESISSYDPITFQSECLISSGEEAPWWRQAILRNLCIYHWIHAPPSIGNKLLQSHYRVLNLKDPFVSWPQNLLHEKPIFMHSFCVDRFSSFALLLTKLKPTLHDHLDCSNFRNRICHNAFELPMYETENGLRYKMPETKLNGRGVLLSHLNSSFSVYLQK